MAGKEDGTSSGVCDESRREGGMNAYGEDGAEKWLWVGGG